MRIRLPNLLIPSAVCCRTCQVLAFLLVVHVQARAQVIPVFDPKVDFRTGIDPSSVHIGDLNGDGKPELVVANLGESSVYVFENTSTPGNASFVLKQDLFSGNSTYSVAIGDLDGDNLPDLVVVNGGENTVSVFRNTTTGGSISFVSLINLTTGTTPISVDIGDLDGDGKLDIAVANVSDNSVSVIRNTSTSGSFTFATKVDFPTGATPRSVAIGDLDGDSKPDLVVTNYGDNNASVLRNMSTSGSVTFAAKVDFPTGAGPRSVAIGDLDGDGKRDLVVANYDENNASVLRNMSSSGSVSFASKVDFQTGDAPNSLDIGDLNGDNQPDLAVANGSNNTVSVFPNMSSSGSVSFAAKEDLPISGLYYIRTYVAIGDLDGDGKSDLAVINGYDPIDGLGNTVSVLRNATATACTNPTSGGTIAAAQSGNSPFDPFAFNSSAAANGHTGTLEYKWQSSITSSSAGFSDISGAISATYDPGSLTQTTWYKRLARVGCKSDWTGAAESNVLQITVNKNWIGGTGNWSTAANWSDGVAPVTGDRLTVSSGTPTLDADFTVGGTLTLSGTGGLNIGPGVRLTVTGTVDFGGRPVTFKSTASGTASLGAVSGTLSNATNVTVERYLPAGRKWRLLTAPLTGSSANSVFANWQNNDAVSVGTGVEIWGPDGVADPGSGNSGLALGPNPSIRSYGASGWQGVTNTNTTLLFDNTTNYGFSLFAAGPYNNGMSVISPSQAGVATTISANGTLIMGDHTKSMTAASAGQFFLIGNPYASSVDPRSFTTTSPVNRTNLNDKLWMWDAKPGIGIGNGLGRYVSFDLSINQYSVLGNGYANHSVMIQSGQAFFVQATAPGAATLVFRETSKDATSSHGMMGDAIDKKAVLRFTLQEQVGTNTENLDGAVAVFHAGGRSGLDPLDGQKLMNTSENLALRREDRNLSFEHRPELSGTDTLRLRLGNMREQEYVLEAGGQGFTQPDMKAELVDRHTGVRQTLDPGGITRYRFTVSKDSMSRGDRFMVVFGSRINGSGVTPEAVSGSPELRLFPNPAMNRLGVRYAVAAAGSLSLKVYDARGALVLERSVEDRSGAGLLELNTSALPGGMYRVLLMDAAGTRQTQTFIRQ